VGLFVDAEDVLLIHQITPPEPDCWDLPGGGLEPSETLMEGLRREVREETGLIDFQVEKLLTVIEDFFPWKDDTTLHTINMVYQCTVHSRPLNLSSTDLEIGPKGIQWLAIAQLTPQQCSTRSWKALQAAELI
jgi:8-oxo-dGTP diphosphatase